MAALGASAEHAQRLHDFGHALDALVRALMQRDALASGLARRVHAGFCDLDAALELTPTELRCEGKLVLAADAQRGRYILPAHAAGLRLLATRAHSVPEDAARLARRLGELEAGELDGADFADWLWGGGALGFDVLQVETTHELGESLIDAAHDARELWLRRSEHAVREWNELSWRAAQSFDAAELARRFGAPLQRLVHKLRRGDFALTLADVDTMRAAADDAGVWSSAELAVLLEQPALAGALPRAHLTWHALSLLELDAQAAPRVFALLSALDAPGEQAGVVDYALLGDALGGKLVAGEFERTSLLALVDAAQPALLAGLLGALLQRGSDCPAAAQALSALLEHWGADALFERIAPERLEPKLAAALLRAALSNGSDPAPLARVCGRMPLASALHALSVCPELIGAAGAALERRIAADPAASAALLPALARSHHAAARIVGRAVLACQGAGFAAEPLRAALRAVALAGLGAELVLPLWQTRAAPNQARIAALFALEADPDALRGVLARRVGHMLEPAEIREALEELRWRQP